MKNGFLVRLSIGTVIQLVLSGYVNAGSMGPAPVGCDQYRWKGISIGGNIGGKWAEFYAPIAIETLTYNGTTYGPSAISHDHTQASFTGGGLIGYDFQVKNLVLGVEANFNGEQLQGYHELQTADIASGSQFLPGDYYRITNNWQSSILGRLGFATGDWLFYLTGGVGFADAKFSINFVPSTFNGVTLPAASTSHSKVLTGGTYGLGTEYAFSENWHAGVEGRYIDYGKESFNFDSLALVATSPTTFITSPVAASLHMRTAEILLKVKYLYNC